jgi:hypothetical protein
MLDMHGVTGSIPVPPTMTKCLLNAGFFVFLERYRSPETEDSTATLRQLAPALLLFEDALQVVCGCAFHLWHDVAIGIQGH